MPDRPLTNVHIDELLEELACAWDRLAGAAPPHATLANAWCTCVMDHGWDPQTLLTRGLWGFNVGNQDGRVYPSLQHGCDAFWDRLASDWPDAVLAMNSDPETLARALRKSGYYCAPEQQIEASIRSMRHLYDNRYQVPSELRVNVYPEVSDVDV